LRRYVYYGPLKSGLNMDFLQFVIKS